MMRVVARESRLIWVIPALLFVVAAGAGWYFLRPVEEPAPPPTPPEPAPAEVEPELPRHPLPEPAPPPEEAEPLPPLPPLDESDEVFTAALLELFGDDLVALLAEDSLIGRSVTTMDNLTRSRVAMRVRPIGPVGGQFEVDAIDEENYLLSERNFVRYDGMVDSLANADLDALVATYQRYYPLLQEAFVGLGYPEGYLNDRVVEVVDRLLDTPVVEEPIRLVQPHVLYEFADPELEALSSGQKMLLRMGAGNAAQVKMTLQQFRARIAGPQVE